jgi:hypothetical protein
MSQDAVRTWFWIAFAIALGLALLVRAFRRSGRHGEREGDEPTVGDGEHFVRERRPPRRQHYAFAHVLLRDCVLDNPAGAFDAATLPGSGDFLVGLWLSAQDAKEPAISPEGLRVTVEGDIALIALPPPARVAEAYMVAIVRDPGAYFVLEKGLQSAFVAEWRRDSRIRMRDVAAATKGAFLASVRAALAERGSDPSPADQRRVVVVCCPYCITPIDEQVRSCATCGADVTKDALVEYTEAAFADAPREPCAACGASRSAIAITCPSCKASLRA